MDMVTIFDIIKSFNVIVWSMYKCVLHYLSRMPNFCWKIVKVQEGRVINQAVICRKRERAKNTQREIGR